MRYEEITFRPIDEWPGELTRWRRRSQFSAPWGRTIALLERELEHLGARRVVLQIAIGEHELRLDGKPRATARAAHPGTILAFESKWGPLKYATDEFDRWQDNLRAIALAMEALRAVDRYGVSRRGEQYTGWRALPRSTDPADSITSREQAREFIDREFEGDLRRALFETHPDHGGSSDDFRRVMRAKELLA